MKSEPSLIEKSGLIRSLHTNEIRMNWISKYHETEKKLAKLRREWNAFEAEAHLIYQQWYHLTYASLLTQIREISEECQECTLTLSSVEAQIRINGLRRSIAFAYVKDKLTKKEDPFPTEEERVRFQAKEKLQFEENFKKQLASNFGNREEEVVDSELLESARTQVYSAVRREFGPQPRSRLDRLMMDQLIDEKIRELYENMKRAKEAGNDGERERENEDETLFFNSEFEQVNESYSDIEGDTNSEPHASNDARETKNLYRKIVRLLHPDRGTEMTREESQIWNEAQLAYQNRDAHALKTILMRVQGGGALQIQNLESIGEIMNIVRSLHFELEEMDYVKRQVKKAFVYRFWASKKRPKNRDKLKREIESSLVQQLIYSQVQLKGLKAEVSRLSRTKR